MKKTKKDECIDITGQLIKLKTMKEHNKFITGQYKYE